MKMLTEPIQSNARIVDDEINAVTMITLQSLGKSGDAFAIGDIQSMESNLR